MQRAAAKEHPSILPEPTQTREERLQGLGSFVDFWGLSFALSLVIGLGLAPALKGSLLGIGPLIDRLDFLASVAGQLAALLTSLLLVHLCLVSIRFAKSRVVALLASIPASLTVILLMNAQRGELNGPSHLTASLATLITMILAVALVRGRALLPPLALGLALVGLGAEIGRSLLAEQDGSSSLADVLSLTRFCAGFALSLSVLFQKYQTSKKTRFLLPLCLGGAFICSLAMTAQAFPDQSGAIVIVGRALSGMAHEPDGIVPLSLLGFHLGVALSAFIWVFLSRLGGKVGHTTALSIAALLSLAWTGPINPLTAAAGSLLAMAFVALTAAEAP